MSHLPPAFSSRSVLVLFDLSVSERYAWRNTATAVSPCTSMERTWTDTSIDLGRSIRSVRCFTQASRDSPPPGSNAGEYAAR